MNQMFLNFIWLQILCNFDCEMVFAILKSLNKKIKFGKENTFTEKLFSNYFGMIIHKILQECFLFEYVKYYFYFNIATECQQIFFTRKLLINFSKILKKT